PAARSPLPGSNRIVQEHHRAPAALASLVGRRRPKGVKAIAMSPRIVNGIEELKTLTGQEVGVSDWLPVTQDMIDRFADVTGDHQWIHVDPERAKRETPFDSTIAHGFLTVSLLPQLSQQAVTVKGD